MQNTVFDFILVLIFNLLLYYTGCSADGSASALGAEGRRFETCHPEIERFYRKFETLSPPPVTQSRHYVTEIGESLRLPQIFFWWYGQVVRQWIANPPFPSSNLGTAYHNSGPKDPALKT